MLRRNPVLLALSALVLGALMLACEGETGPAGPAGPQGPAGPGQILAFGSITNNGATAAVAVVGPTTVTAVATRTGAGVCRVTLTGDFPTTLPSVLATVGGPNASKASLYALADLDCYTGTNVGTSCAANEIVFDTFVTDETGAAFDEDYQFVILANP